MRAFIAIDLIDNDKKNIEELYPYIINNSKKIRLVKPHNIHLTLCFLGEINEIDINNTIEIMNEISVTKHSFELCTTEFGLFKRKHGNVLWLGIGGDITSLNEIAYELKNKLGRYLTNITNYKYHPHITLGRDVVTNSDINSWQKFKSFSWKVDRIVLMESKRVNGELQYIPFHHAIFNY